MSEGGIFNAGSAVAMLGLDTSGFAKGQLTAQSLMNLFPSMVTSFMANPLLGIIDLAKQVSSEVASMFSSVMKADGMK